MTHAGRLYATCAVLCVTMLVFAKVASEVGGVAYFITLGIAALAYLFMIREFTRGHQYSRLVVYTCLALGTAWQVPFFLVTPGPQDDVLRYLWDGRLQKLGYNPYTALPSDLALASLHTVETRNMNNQDVPSPYPAGAQLFFRGVTTIHESAFAFKVAFALCNLGVIALLLVELGRNGQEHWALAYAWHPLLVTCVYYNSHIDVLGLLILLVSIAALGRRQRMLAAAAFGLAIAVKFLPIVLAPLYWGRLRMRDWLLAACVVGLLYLPFLNRGALPTGSLSAFVQRFRFNDPVFAVLEKWMRPQLAAAVAVVCGLATAVWMRRRRSIDRLEAWAWPIAASLICLPVIYPWYLLWVLPFLKAGSTFILRIWTLSVLSVFVVWHLYALGRPWQVPGWVLALEFLPVLIGFCAREMQKVSER